MAGASLFTLLDDIAVLLDDISVMTKVAAKKTAGVLGDDLALNADQVTGMAASRELPVIWAVSKGAMLNKVVLLPAALLISSLLPWLIKWLLMLGGAFLCYEGFHKVYQHLFRRREVEAHRESLREVRQTPEIDLVAFEKNKIKGAIRTDFILSAEIVVIALGAVSQQTLPVQVGVLIALSILVVVGVYGLVSIIVKLDDIGYFLARQRGQSVWVRGVRALGQGLISAAPWLMKALSVVGTLAMFLVGGGIFAHNIAALEGLFQRLAHLSGPLAGVLMFALPGVLGFVLGGIVSLGVAPLEKLWQRRRSTGAESAA